ncbi:hypothetical protein [Mariniluteicoccus flavus]
MLDDVTIIDGGRTVVAGPLADLKEDAGAPSLERLYLDFTGSAA